MKESMDKLVYDINSLIKNSYLKFPDSTLHSIKAKEGTKRVIRRIIASTHT